jgi:hypothetical protein
MLQLYNFMRCPVEQHSECNLKARRLDVGYEVVGALNREGKNVLSDVYTTVEAAINNIYQQGVQQLQSNK